MNTSVYISSDEILSVVAPMCGDKEMKVIPRGFYYSLIQKAFEELALDTFFQELRADINFPEQSLTLDLPEGCFNVKNVYIFTGDECVIHNSHKVWWKRNYYTTGNGYIANDKGNNGNDPFFQSHAFAGRFRDKSTVRFNDGNPNKRLFYNIQMGNLMLSASCRGKGNKIHIHYNGTGCAIGEAPIIPVFLRTAMEDYAIEAGLRFRMANEPSSYRQWADLQQRYERRLDRGGYNGSWPTAEMRVKSMNESQREELKEYLGRGGWASGF